MAYKFRTKQGLKKEKHTFSKVLLFTAFLMFIVGYYVIVEFIMAEDSAEVFVLEETQEPLKEYDIPIDSFSKEERRIENGEVISIILKNCGLSYDTTVKIIDKMKPFIDVKNFRAGNKYLLYRTLDTFATLKYFVYTVNSIDYIKVNLSDSIVVTKESRNVKVIKRTSTAYINSSLWATISENHLNPLLAIGLSEIYSWSIDFFTIQKGDGFEVVYDEIFVDDTLSVGIGNIYVAWFKHNNKKYYAYQFKQDSVVNYWDFYGQSLRKEFLKAPLKFTRISSKFTNSRFHPVLKRYRSHHGVDYAAPSGTPVYALGSGKVVAKFYDTKGGGNYIKIQHSKTYSTGYMHLSGYASGISVGSRVVQGQLIAYVGSTGLSTGPHLDFRVWKDGNPIDPLTMKSDPVDPIKPSYKKSYDSLVNIANSNFLNKFDTSELAPSIEISNDIK